MCFQQQQTLCVLIMGIHGFTVNWACFGTNTRNIVALQHTHTHTHAPIHTHTHTHPHWHTHPSTDTQKIPISLHTPINTLPHRKCPSHYTHIHTCQTPFPLHTHMHKTLFPLHTNTLWSYTRQQKSESPPYSKQYVAATGLKQYGFTWLQGD